MSRLPGVLTEVAGFARTSIAGAVDLTAEEAECGAEEDFPTSALQWDLPADLWEWYATCKLENDDFIQLFEDQ